MEPMMSFSKRGEMETGVALVVIGSDLTVYQDRGGLSGGLSPQRFHVLRQYF